MGKRLKKCSASTDAEATTESSQNVLDDMGVTLKKQKKESDEDEKTALKKVEEYKCSFDDKDAFGDNDRTIFVRGFDCSLPRDDIKSALEKHFGSCEITRVFVPIECKTGSPIGTAFIDVSDDVDKEMALALDGSFLGSSKLEVKMANRIARSVAYPNFKGCRHCLNMIMKRKCYNFNRTCGGLLQPRTASWISLIEKLDAKVKMEKAEAEKQS
ncbi:unnamed protein product [Arabidopsis halleri]